MDASLDLVIAGAGIGGLTLAVALRKRGFRPRVFERASELLPLGAGITVQPNAMRALRTLGLERDVEAAGAVVESAALLASNGRVLTEQRMGALTSSIGAPAVAIHRARLHELLLRAAGDSVRTGHPVRGFREEGERVLVEVEGEGELAADVLVGADGLHSAVRARMLGDTPMRYAGYTGFRGVVELPEVARTRRTTESWGRGARFGVVPVSAEQVYWFAVLDAPAGTTFPDPRAELLARFGSWHAPIPTLLEATPLERWIQTDIADREPISRYTRGRVALLGDAAHPMTPNLGQGGCQAIEDAVVLAAELSNAPSVASALDRYDAARVARANGVVEQARRLGAVGQWSNPLATAIRDTLMRLVPSSTSERRIRALWEFTPPG